MVPAKPAKNRIRPDSYSTHLGKNNRYVSLDIIDIIAKFVCPEINNSSPTIRPLAVKFH